MQNLICAGSSNCRLVRCAPIDSSAPIELLCVGMACHQTVDWCAAANWCLHRFTTAHGCGSTGFAFA
jgi:hypothetical protein